MIRNILKRRILFAILMAAMLFGVAFLSAFTCPPANARGCSGFQKLYYSDATYSILIGEFIRNCDGSSSVWGSTSTYKVINTIECGC
jgi:hypothetical protein